MDAWYWISADIQYADIFVHLIAEHTSLSSSGINIIMHTLFRDEPLADATIIPNKNFATSFVLLKK